MLYILISCHHTVLYNKTYKVKSLMLVIRLKSSMVKNKPFRGIKSIKYHKDRA